VLSNETPREMGSGVTFRGLTVFGGRTGCAIPGIRSGKGSVIGGGSV